MNIKILILLSLTIATISLEAQIKKEMKLCELDSINGMVIHSIAEVSPEYTGGLSKFYKDLSSKIKIKDTSNSGHIKIIISFVIDVDGNVKNVCTTDNVEITTEIIESINNWTAKKIGGSNVPVRMYMPIYIKLG
ncbi:MAG TPA: hypothetical protein VD884_12500 [Ohtaekwangia sp.]|nr:hypothetical protein [Ohtaekwangia sp.]